MVRVLFNNLLSRILPKKFLERDYVECFVCKRKVPFSHTTLSVVPHPEDEKSLEAVCYDCL